MGLSAEEKEKREQDEHVKYITGHVCNKDGEKSYVFISYKSDDWEIVLQDIVYRLVKEEGLNVYFDGDFGGHNSHWTTQFPENMRNPKCKGVLAFLDDKYATSYATLLELMYSQCLCQDSNYDYVKKHVIPVNLGHLSAIKDKSDTGLGKTEYPDGGKNPKAEAEKKLFDRAFQRGCKEGIFDRSVQPYEDNHGSLPKDLCSLMLEELLAKIDCNDNAYQNKGDSIKNIVASIQSVCGSEVFSKGKENGEITEKTTGETIPTPEPSNLWIYTTKGIVARLEWDGESKSCVVKAGSQVAKEAPGFAKLEPAKNMKAKLVNDGVIVNEEFTRDYQCGKISTMINLLAGGSVSMPLATENGSLRKDDGSLVTAKKTVKNNKPKEMGGRTVIITGSSGIKVDEAITLKQFEEACENINFCVELRNKREHSKKQMFDYLVAALLRGCDANVNKAQNGTDGEILRRGGYNYCTYTISNNVNAINPRIGSSQFTWCSNARKAMKTEDMPEYFFAEDGRVKSGHLGEYSEIFEALDENLTIGDVLKKFEAKEKGFETKNNDGIFEAWKLIKQIGSDIVNGGNGKQTIGDLLK